MTADLREKIDELRRLTAQAHDDPVYITMYSAQNHAAAIAPALADALEAAEAEVERLRAALQHEITLCSVCNGTGRAARYEHDSASGTMELAGFQGCYRCGWAAAVLRGGDAGT